MGDPGQGEAPGLEKSASARRFRESAEVFWRILGGMALIVLTAKEMRDADQDAIGRVGIPSIQLMEKAGAAVVSVIERRFPKARDVLVVVGKGNNGGDGLVIARLLRRMGTQARVWLACDPTGLSGDAAINRDRARDAGVAFHGGAGVAIRDLEVDLATVDLVVDAVFGTGLQGAPRGFPAEVISALACCDVPIIAVDGPSGLSGDTGQVPGAIVSADVTVALGALKLGLLLHPARAYCGDLEVVDIGIPAESLERTVPSRLLWEPEDVLATLPSRAADAHKGSVGRLAVIAGSPGMTGAACLTAEAALRSGAGLVYLAAPEVLLPTLAVKLTEVVLCPLPCASNGFLDVSSVLPALEVAEQTDAVVLGPGLGRVASPFVAEFLRGRGDWPLLVDADGLNALEPRLGRGIRPGRDVLTPHLGELASLLGRARIEPQGRLEALLDVSRVYSGAVVVAKGAPTLVGSIAEPVRVVGTGNSGMATAGMGDVLSGVIGALLAAGVSALDAATAGAFLHGVAGDIAAEEFGVGLLAGDVRDRVPAAILEILGQDGGGGVTGRTARQ